MVPSGPRISMYIRPPGRGSTSITGLEKLWGPHHWARYFGSVHAFQTSSRGASKTRVRLSSLVSTSLFLAVMAGMFLLLPLQFAQIFVEPIEALLPELAIFTDPVGD